jgi:predicted nucleotidyltransferase
MDGFNKKKIEEIAKKHDLRLLLLFGSQVSGKKHKFSDYDFGFVSKKESDYKKRAALARDLRMLAGNMLVEDVDLKKAGPFLLKEVVKSNKVLFEEDNAYSDFFSHAVRTYSDAGKLFKLQDIMYNQTINKYRKKIYDKQGSY